MSLLADNSKLVKLSLNTKGRPGSLNLDGFLEEEKTPRGGWVISDFKTQLQILYVLKTDMLLLVMIEKERLLSGIAQVTSTPSPQFSKYGSLFLDVKNNDLRT